MLQHVASEIHLSCLVVSVSWLQHTPGMAPHLSCSSPTPPHQPSPQAAFYPHCASPQGFCVLVSWLLATQHGRTQGLSNEGENYPVRSSAALPSPSEPPLIFPIPLCQCSQHHAHGTPLDFCPPLLPSPSSGLAPTNGLDTCHASLPHLFSLSPLPTTPTSRADSAAGTEGLDPQPA